MKLDLALEGFAILFMFAVIFGAIAHVVLARSSTPWMGLVGAVAFFVGGLITSELFFAEATVEDVQPFIGGLAVDESLFGGLLLGVPVALVTWFLARRYRLSHSIAS